MDALRKLQAAIAAAQQATSEAMSTAPAGIERQWTLIVAVELDEAAKLVTELLTPSGE
jgi:hypothetical protein